MCENHNIYEFVWRKSRGEPVVKHLGYTITKISAFAEIALEAEDTTTTHQTHMRIPLDERETPFCAFCANGTVIITRNNEKNT